MISPLDQCNGTYSRDNVIKVTLSPLQIEMVSFRNYFWGVSSIKRHHMDKNEISSVFLGFLSSF